MKKILSAAMLLCLCAILIYPALADSDAVPAALPFAKNGIPGARIVFYQDDFGAGADAVMLVSVPSPAAGVLELDGEVLRGGDVISVSDADKMVFVPLSGDELSASFDYIPIAGSFAGNQATVSINLAAERCYAPLAEDVKMTAGKSMRVLCPLRASDPDGDVERFIILSQPKKGAVEIVDGVAVFASDKTGKTSFTYCAVDSKGNRSEPAEVSVKIEKFKTDMLYDDESGSLLEYPAAVLAEKDIYTGRRVGGMLLLEAGRSMTRAEFVAMAMRAAGIAPSETTASAYDAPVYSGHLSAAVDSGVILDESVRANDEVTLAEAAVILDRLFSEGSAGARYIPSVSGSAPAWAENAAANLMCRGALDGSEEMSSVLTVGQAVMMIYAIISQ